MSDFVNYTHLECTVPAIQLSAETENTIASVLTDEAINQLLASLTIKISKSGVKEFTFRYKTNSTELTLTEGNYLVQLNDGCYTVVSASTFESEYIATSTDPIIAAEDSLTVMESLKVKLESNVISSEDITAYIALSKDTNYDATNDVLKLDLTNSAITNPTGLSAYLIAASKVDFLTENTKFFLDLSTTGTNKINFFNQLSLDLLLGELKIATSAVAKRINKLSLKDSVSANVTETKWEAFKDALCLKTSIQHDSDIIK